MFISRLITFAPWILLVLIGGYHSWSTSRFETQLTLAKKSEANARNAVALVVSTNKTLSIAIQELKESHEEERVAALAVDAFNSSVNERLNLAVGEIKGLLNEESDSCGDQRLPDAVIQRMWQYYGPRSGDTVSDDIVSSTSRVSSSLSHSVQPASNDQK